jgi:CysZ protein
MHHHELTGLRGAWTAFGAPFRGVGILAARPRLWPLALTPTALLLGLFALGGTVATDLFHRAHTALVGRLGASWYGTVGRWLGDALVAVLLAFAVVLLALLLVPPLAAPFMDSLAGRLDVRPQPHEPLLRQVFRAVRVALAGLGLVAIPQIVLWTLSLLVPALAWLFGSLAFAVAAFGLAYDAFDWPLARRGMGVRARLQWMGAHGALTLGLGLAVWLLALVPGLPIVMLPAIVAGAVSLVNTVER